MTAILSFIAFVGGYAASVYSWPKIRLFINGAQAEARALRAKADALLASIRTV